MATKKQKKYTIELNFFQTTDGNLDGRTLVEEFSSDLTVHAIKTQVFTEELTEAIAKATKRLTDMAIAVSGEK
mgnify:CR=1 FL=1